MWSCYDHATLISCVEDLVRPISWVLLATINASHGFCLCLRKNWEARDVSQQARLCVGSIERAVSVTWVAVFLCLIVSLDPSFLFSLCLPADHGVNASWITCFSIHHMSHFNVNLTQQWRTFYLEIGESGLCVDRDQSAHVVVFPLISTVDDFLSIWAPISGCLVVPSSRCSKNLPKSTTA